MRVSILSQTKKTHGLMSDLFFFKYSKHNIPNIEKFTEELYLS